MPERQPQRQRFEDRRALALLRVGLVSRRGGGVEGNGVKDLRLVVLRILRRERRHGRGGVVRVDDVGTPRQIARAVDEYVAGAIRLIGDEEERGRLQRELSATRQRHELPAKSWKA